MSIPTSMNFVDHGQGGEPEVLVPAQCAVPHPAAGEVLVRVAYAGVNRPDCLQRSGRYPPPVGASPIVGLEVSGEVVALGEGVTQWKLGDKLCALTNGGAYAEYVTVPQGPGARSRIQHRHRRWSGRTTCRPASTGSRPRPAPRPRPTPPAPQWVKPRRAGGNGRCAAGSRDG